MCTAVYEPLEATDMSWYCCNCGIPNFNSSLFTEFEHDNISQCDTTSNSTPSNTGDNIFFDDPLSTSSPQNQRKPLVNRKIRVMSINFQSIRSKKEEFWSMLEYSDPDIILASETWLNPNIKEREILPPSYTFAARRDRPNSSHGGVAIITKSNIGASEIPLQSNTEIVAASIPSSASKPIIVCSVYRPTDNNVDYTQNLTNTIRDLHSNYPK